MTNEQRQAFDQLRVLALPSRFRVKPDAEGFPVIPGRQGAIEWTGEPDTLAVFTTRRRLHAPLLALLGVRRRQTGDDELRAYFPVEALEAVARAIRAYRRRSSASAARLAGHTAYRFTKRPPEPLFVASEGRDRGGPRWGPPACV